LVRAVLVALVCLVTTDQLVPLFLAKNFLLDLLDLRGLEDLLDPLHQ
jgi:hypothetical protein